jgi:hypothetical protein
MPKLRFILLSVSVLALSGLTSGTILPSHAAAQSSSDTYMLEIQDMISWMKGAAEVTVAMTEVFNSQQMNDLMFSLSADTLDVNKLEKQFSEFELLMDSSIVEAEQRFAALPAPERWDIGGWSTNSFERKMHRIAVEYYDYLPQSIEAISGAYTEFAKLINFVIDGHGEFDFQKFSTESAIVSIEALTSENNLLRGFVNALPRSSPNHWYHKVMIDINKSMIAETHVLIAAAEPDPVRMMEMRQEAGQEILSALENTSALITSGRSKISGSVAETNQILETRLSPDERALYESVREATLTFANTFDIEFRIYELQMDNAEMYASDLPDAKIDPIIMENDTEFIMLIGERHNLTINRMSILQQ